MKKNLKLILLIVFIVLFLVAGIVVLYSMNIFKDTSDLVCVMEYPETENKQVITFKFNKNAVVEEYIEKQVVSFSSNEEAKNFYDNILKSNSEQSDNQITVYYDSSMELIDNKIETSFYFKVAEPDEKYKKTKEELVEMYEKEYMYECQ